MSIFAWCSQRAGALSIITLVSLCYWVISEEYGAGLSADKPKDNSAPDRQLQDNATTGAGFWALIFAYYSLFIHVLVFIFPIRACWSVWSITSSLKKAAQSQAVISYKRGSAHRRPSLASISSSDTLTSGVSTCPSNANCSPTSEMSNPELDNYAGRSDYTDDTDYTEDGVVHAIMIPNYKEEMDTLQETLEVLASHPQARSSYDVSRQPTAKIVSEADAPNFGLDDGDKRV